MKKALMAILSAVFLYSALMIVLRLKMTELGYQFEEAKSYERALREEQIKLRAILAEKVSVNSLRSKRGSEGYLEPHPDQIVIIP